VFTDLLMRARALFKRTAVEREIDEELRFHFDRQVEAFQRSGLDRAEALRRARLEFGGIDQVKEEYRDALGIRMLDQLQRDLRLASRSLRATPIVTVVAILSIALGIGANTAIFSVVNSLLLKPLPVDDPSRLVLVTDSVPTRLRAWTSLYWDQIRQRPQLFEHAAAWSFNRFNLATGGETRFIDGLWATGSFFETMGVGAVVGRTFSGVDDQRGGGPDGAVAVISYRMWQERFGGETGVVGRALTLDGVTFTIVGVTPPDFFGPDVGRAVDVIVPLATEPLIRGRDSALDSRGRNFLSVIARLKPGESIEQATIQLRNVQEDIRAATAEDVRGASPQVIERHRTETLTLLPAATGASNLRGRYQQPLIAILIVAALVLLMACVNVANLLLARSATRRHQLSVQLAIGASRWQIARQLVIESVLLSAAGAAAGMAIASWSSQALVAQISTSANAVFLDLSNDGRVLAFTLAVATAATILFGTAPAFRAFHVAPGDALKEQGRTAATPSRGPLGWLLVAQVALSVVLVAAAGLFVRSFISLSTRDLGFEPSRVLVVYVDPQRAAVDRSQTIPMYERIRDAVGALPNVAGAALSLTTPVGGGEFTPTVTVTGLPKREVRLDVFGNLISPGWFKTFGTPVVAGRDFTDRDRLGAPRVAVVNEAFVQQVLGGDNPLGRTIAVFAERPNAPPPMEIVGVVRDAVYSSVRNSAPPTWYAPLAQFDLPMFAPLLATTRLSVRAIRGSPAALASSVVAAIAAENSRVTLTFRPLVDQLRAARTQERLLASLAGMFGVLAMLLAGLGLYGVTAYAVSRRRGEIGIRMALGAGPQSVVRLVLGRVTLLVGLGVAIGSAVSLWAATLVGSLVYGVHPQDLATLLSAVLALSAIGAATAWLPARRAARIDPVAVLREG
jgi:putative ABC transport system permease protein